MNKQIESLKLALEALEHCKDVIIERGLNGNPEFAKKWGLALPLEQSQKAITAVRKALAEESSGTEQPAQQEQGPVCYKHGDEPKQGCAWCYKQPAQQQEPVAWMFEDDEDNGHKTFRQTPPSPEAVAYLAKWKRPAWVPLYTSPPTLSLAQRKQLTDDQIKIIYEDCDAPTGCEFTFAFVRAIEAAHGIKEKNL